jgi:hypothetical protein
VSKTITLFIEDLDQSDTYTDADFEPSEPGEYEMVIDKKLGLHVSHAGASPPLHSPLFKCYGVNATL